MSTIDFNANEVEPMSAPEPIPSGLYQVVISESEMRQTRAGAGEYLQLTLEVVDGEFHGRRLFVRLNLINQNSEAVRIARSELSAICRAVNVMVLHDTVELHNIPFMARVEVRKDKDGILRNEVRGYEAKGVVAPQPAVTRTAPWERH